METAAPRDTPLAPLFLVDGAAYLSPLRMADVLGLSHEQLAEHAQVAMLVPETHPQDVVLQAFLNETLDVLEAVVARGSTLREAIAWYMTEALSDVDECTPEELVATGRLNAVLRYVAGEAGAC